ncbi:sortilin-related receptor-like [Xenia sp. Carnegie-2017]|uniref:sortilin-related receptor-like n=1 Tax=Xenia sp. Carnegie-2017 TaxID=2897299 RepID=UPI001F0504A4|nr:sortilin-related receptor-like [Xenia sp. Carnegie-2017]
MSVFKFFIATLTLIVLAQAVISIRVFRRRYRNPYRYVTKCKPQTEKCVSLRCSRFSRTVRLPFSYSYACCTGRLYDERNYVCVRYRYGRHTRIVLQRCNPCRQFRCASGECTLKRWRCNNVKDCTDGSDEVGCPRCIPNFFTCRRTRQCIKKRRVCDKINNCADGSDEVGCPTPLGNKCGPNSYRCRNNKCILWRLACNGYNNCGDWSDEKGYFCKRYGLLRRRRRRRLGKKRDEIPNDDVSNDEVSNGGDGETGTTSG